MREIFKKIIIRLLARESVAVLKKYKPRIVAITGTVGKTSTRDAVYAVLSKFDFVRKSPKNFNTEFGIPLTILDAPNPGSNTLGWLKVLLDGLVLIAFPHHYPRWLVLEVGTDRPGDIAEVTKWLRPDIVIVTRLAEVPVHVEAFSSPEELFAEKGNLVKALKPGGTLILNADDERVREYKNLTTENTVYFESGQNYEIAYENNVPTGIKFEVEGQSVFIPGTLGRQHMEHVSAAMAVAKLLGDLPVGKAGSLAVAAKCFERGHTSAGRMRLIEGTKGATIIDDTYNSSPVAVEEALKTLKSVKSKRKIAVLGDMLELGRYTVDEHRKVGERVAKAAKMLGAVGIRSRYTAEAALAAGMKEDQVFQFDDSAKAGEFIKDLIKEGDTVLVKGSQGMRMEKVAEALMAHPEDKQKLLVRQDTEWENR